MNFSQALDAIKHGALLTRKGWNGSGMFIFYCPGTSFKVDDTGIPILLPCVFKSGDIATYLPTIDMKTKDGTLVPWLASQSDILADDWEYSRED